MVVIITIVSIVTIVKQVVAIEPAWIDVSSIATIPENPVIGEKFSCLITTSYSNPDKLACGLVLPGAPDNTIAIDICMKNEKTGTGYQGYGNNTRGYKCITNTHPNNTVSARDFDLVAVSFDCDGNCSKIVKRHRMRILDHADIPTVAPTSTPVPVIPTIYVTSPPAPTDMELPTNSPVESSTEPISIISPSPESFQPLPVVLVTPVTNSSDAPLVEQRPYSVSVISKSPQSTTVHEVALLRPEVINKMIVSTTTFLGSTFHPFTQRSDIEVWESAKHALNNLYMNFINEAGL
ncbi:MAG: hypothetical protein WCO78_03980 [Candidatus Roizmanbacteria bacterium]